MDDANQRDQSAPAMPRWVKGLVIAGVAVIAVLVIVMLIVGGEHGPGLHSLGDGSGLTSGI